MKRWLLWNLYCLRGRRCADLVVDMVDPRVAVDSILINDFTCGSCGTHYRREALVIAPGVFVLSERRLLG